MSSQLQPPNQVKVAQMRNTVEQMLRAVGRSKLAADAGVDENAENQTTAHPSKSVDDGTQPASTGFRDAENSAQVKKEQGAAGVESASAAPSLDSVQPNIGTHQSLTGEDASIETSSTKATKEDGGFDGPSSHPARTDNNALNGGKYATFLDNLKKAETLGRELLADAVVTAGTPAPAAQPDLAKAAAAGAAAATSAATATVSQAELQKQADAVATRVLHETIQFAEQCAEKTAHYLTDFFQHLNAEANAQPAAAAANAAGRAQKRASDDESDDDDKKEEKAESDTGEKSESKPSGGGSNSAPPSAPPTEPSAPAPDMMAPPAAAPPTGGDPLADMLGSVDPAMGGGAPPADPTMGGDPAAMGGDPTAMGGDPAAMGGGGDALANLPPEVLEMLLQALQAQGGASEAGKMAGHGKTQPVDKRARAAHTARVAYVRELLRA